MTITADYLTLTRKGDTITVHHEDGRRLGTISATTGQVKDARRGECVDAWLSGVGLTVAGAIDATDPDPIIDDAPIPGHDTDGDQDRCPTCQGDGRLCYDCGSVDQPAIGRKILYLMRNDRPTLLRILSATPRCQWPLLAQAYVGALGLTKQGQGVPVLGVVSLWGMLIREAA